MKRLIAVAVITALLLDLGAVLLVRDADAQSPKEQIVGAWTLVSAVELTWFGGSTFANILGAGEQKRLITSLTPDELRFTNPRTPSGATLEVAGNGRGSMAAAAHSQH